MLSSGGISDNASAFKAHYALPVGTGATRANGGAILPTHTEINVGCVFFCVCRLLFASLQPPMHPY